MIDYILLSQLKARLGTSITGDAADDNLRTLITECSREVELYTSRRFDHRIETRTHSVRSTERGGDVAGLNLWLNDDLLSTISVTNGDGTTVLSGDYVLLPPNASCKDTISLNPFGGSIWAHGTGHPDVAIAVSGIWGWGGSWRPSGATLAANTSADAVTLSVSGVTGFERGHVLRIGSEYFQIIGDVSASPLSVGRAVNGSTASLHSSGAAVEIFIPDPKVTALVARLIAWRLEQRKTPLYGTVTIGDFQAPVDISALPKDVQGDIFRLKRKLRIKAA
jgi:hypothetical protein